MRDKKTEKKESEKTTCFVPTAPQPKVSARRVSRSKELLIVNQTQRDTERDPSLRPQKTQKSDILSAAKPIPKLAEVTPIDVSFQRQKV